MKTIAYTLAARRQLRKLSPQIWAQIEERIARYAEFGLGDVKALQGRTGARLRIGDFRVIFVETDDAVEVRAVGDRRDIYR